MADRLEHVIANLGTPKDPTPEGVREFLAEFLGDPLVVQWPAWLWKPILHGIVLRNRPKRIARLYQSVWSERGAPLRVQTEDLVQALSEAVGVNVHVTAAYRYGNPSIEACIRRAFERSNRVVFTQLFPQRAASSSETANREAQRVARELGREKDLVVAPLSPVDPRYISALADRVRGSLPKFEGGVPPHLLVSFHSIPASVNRQEGEVYTQDCTATFEALLAELGWNRDNAGLAYQSVFGPAKWVGPATSDRIAGLAAGGTKRLLVTMPGFLCDGLETLEEIGVEGRGTFLAAGGSEYHCAPAVAGHPALLESLASLSAGTGQ